MKTLQEYFNETTLYFPNDDIIKEFSKDEFDDFLKNLFITYEVEIKKYKTMDYNDNEEFESLVTLIDKISKFQTFCKDYDKIKSQFEAGEKLFAAIKKANKQIDEFIDTRKNNDKL